MSVTTFVAPELFDGLLEYASKVERDREVSSAPTNFCDNFYAQFFQNRMKKEITGFGKADKESAIKLRLKVEATEAKEIALLITWFERYCDVRYDVFSEEYGDGNGEALSVFQDYLDILLERITGWARLEKLTDIERKSVDARSALQRALQSMNERTKAHKRNSCGCWNSTTRKQRKRSKTSSAAVSQFAVGESR